MFSFFRDNDDSSISSSCDVNENVIDINDDHEEEKKKEEQDVTKRSPRHMEEDKKELQQQQPQQKGDDTADVGIASFAGLHRKTCLARSTLAASVQDVALQHPDQAFVPPNTNNHQLLYEPEKHEEMMQQLQERFVLKNSRNSSTTPQKSNSQSILLSPSKLVSAIASMALSPFRNDDEYYDVYMMNEQQQKDDDDATTVLPLDDNAQLFNEPLFQSCLDALTRLVRQRVGSSGDATTPSTTVSDINEHCLVWTLDAWRQWIQKDDETSRLLQHLPVDQCRLLWQLLEMQGLVQCVQGREGQANKELIVYVGDRATNTICEKNNNEVLVSYRIALYDLHAEQCALEQQQQQWMNRAKECETRALIAKKQQTQQQQKQALHYMQQRKLYLQKADEANGSLWNLEHTAVTLQQAAQQRGALQALDQARLAFCALRLEREQGGIDIDTLQDDLRDEMDHLQQINDDLAAMAISVGGDIDDDALMRELEAMNLEEEEKDDTATMVVEQSKQKEEEKEEGSLPTLTSTASDNNIIKSEEEEEHQSFEQPPNENVAGQEQSDPSPPDAALNHTNNKIKMKQWVSSFRHKKGQGKDATAALSDSISVSTTMDSSTTTTTTSTQATKPTTATSLPLNSNDRVPLLN